MSETIRVEGAARLQATLARAGREIGDMRAPLAAVAGKVARDGSDRAPKRTGRLAGSIRASRVSANVAPVAAGVPYAGRTEYGWAAVGQRPQPFLVPALAANEVPAVVALQKRAQTSLNRVEGA